MADAPRTDRPPLPEGLLAELAAPPAAEAPEAPAAEAPPAAAPGGDAAAGGTGAVPPAAAPAPVGAAPTPGDTTVDDLVDAGVKIIFNYSEALLQVPPEVTVHTSSPAVDLLYALYFYLT